MDHHDRRFDYFKLLATLSFAALLAFIVTVEPKLALHAKSLSFRFGFVPLALAMAGSLLALFLLRGPLEPRPALKPNEVDVRGFVFFLFALVTPSLLLIGVVGFALTR